MYKLYRNAPAYILQADGVSVALYKYRYRVSQWLARTEWKAQRHCIDCTAHSIAKFTIFFSNYFGGII